MDLIFKKLELNDLKKIKELLYQSNSYMCDYTLGILYMRKEYYETLICYLDESNILLKAKFDKENNKYLYYFPLGNNYLKSLELISLDALKTNSLPLEFACLNNSNLEILRDYFPIYKYEVDKMWSDYLYLNEDFIYFKGKKFQEKRHQLNTFKKLYPSAYFKKSDFNNTQLFNKEINDSLALIDEFIINKNNQLNEIGLNEAKKSKEVLKNIRKLNFDLYLVYDKEKLIGFSVCEIVNDVIFDHIEKCNRFYKGIYPYLINNIAIYNKDRVKYFNREDDSGDLGLRQSKKSYNPIKLVDKIAFKVLNNMTLLSSFPFLKVDENILLKKIDEDNMKDYYLLAINEKRDKYWGYDYKLHLKENEKVDPLYFYNDVINDFKNKSGLSLLIYFQDKFSGEVVLYDYKNDNSLELGIRLIEEMEGKNIGYKTIYFLLTYLKENIHINKIRMKCFKENIKSDKLINRLNFKFINEDETFKYYEYDLK